MSQHCYFIVTILLVLLVGPMTGAGKASKPSPADSAGLQKASGIQDKNCTADTTSGQSGPGCGQTCNPGFTWQYGKCVRASFLNERCQTDSNCAARVLGSECHIILKICICKPGYKKIVNVDGTLNCEAMANYERLGKVDMAMIGTLISLFIIFIIVCFIFEFIVKPKPQEIGASYIHTDTQVLSTPQCVCKGTMVNQGEKPKEYQMVTIWENNE